MLECVFIEVHVIIVVVRVGKELILCGEHIGRDVTATTSPSANNVANADVRSKSGEVAIAIAAAVPRSWPSANRTRNSQFGAARLTMFRQPRALT